MLNTTVNGVKVLDAKHVWTGSNNGDNLSVGPPDIEDGDGPVMKLVIGDNSAVTGEIKAEKVSGKK